MLRLRTFAGLCRDRLVQRDGQAAIHAQRAARPTFRDLWDAEVSVYSQWGEDGILDYLCDMLEISRPRCLEIGAGNFLECNTRFLAEFRSASVLAIDGRPDLVATLRHLPVSWRTTVIPWQVWVNPENARRLTEVSRRQLGGLDVVSLDVDGIDYWIAQALDLGSVSIVVVEYNALFGASKAVSIPLSNDFRRESAHYSGLFYGASLPAFVHLLSARGFDFVGTNRPGTNAFFVQSGIRAAIPLPEPGDLTRYVRSTVREARDQRGRLSFLSGAERVALIEHLWVQDVISGERLQVRALGTTD